MAAPMFNVFVGAETGLLKGVNVKRKLFQNVNSVQDVSRDKEICVMCYSSQDEKKISFGLKNREILKYDRESGVISSPLHCPGGQGAFKGLCRYDSCCVTCVESGLVKVWNETTEDSMSFEAGDRVCRMQQNPWQPSLIATGGKENDLKVWDLNNEGKSVFKAKNVAHDWLNLRVPVWVLDLAFLPGSQQILTSTGHHQIRLYDPAAQKRPVMDMTFDEHPITSLSLTTSGNQAVVGTSVGNMGLLDIRKGKLVHAYKGFSGGIRCVQCHPTLPLVASCGLDRFLRIHDIHTKELLHKFYLKSRLNCLLLSSQWDCETKPSAQPMKSHDEQLVDSGINEEDELWDSLDVVGNKTAQKKTTKRKVANTAEPRRSKRGKKQTGQ